MKRSRRQGASLAAVLMMATPAMAYADAIPAVAEASNMQIIGHSDLNGAGKGGEGLALRQYPNGQRMLFLAHESAPMCFSVIDVTKPVGTQVKLFATPERSRQTVEPRCGQQFSSACTVPAPSRLKMTLRPPTGRVTNEPFFGNSDACPT